MLKLQKLIFKNIGRFVEEQVLDFESLGLLSQLDGQNLNTGGSSGAGKSTVANAIDFLFGTNDVPLTILQSRLTKEKISVVGFFDLDGKPLRLERSKGKLSVDLDGTLVHGSNDLAEKKLDQILGMPRHLFRQTMHKRQKEGGFFLSFTPKETYEFLADCLGHTELIKKLAKVELGLQQAQNKKDTLTVDLISVESALQATRDAIAAIGSAPVADITSDHVVALLGRATASETVLKQIQDRHRDQLLELNTRKPVMDVNEYIGSGPELAKELGSVRSEIQRIRAAEQEFQYGIRSQIQSKQSEKDGLEKTIRTESDLRSKAVRIATEIKVIRSSLCPTCEQSWATDQAKQKESELCQDLMKIKADLDKVSAAKESLVSIQVDIDSLQKDRTRPAPEALSGLEKSESELISRSESEKAKEVSHNRQESARVQALRATWDAEVLDTRTVQDRDQAVARGQLDLDRRAWEQAKARLDGFERDSSQYLKTFQTLERSRADREQKSQEIRSSLPEIEADLLAIEETRRATKSFISHTFDDALEHIGSMATRIIRGIPNMANATIQLEAVKETKDGKIKEEVNATLNVNDEIGVPIKSLSGGERTALDLAIDLAVIEFMESGTGTGLDVFLLDEPFQALDTQNIEMVLEVLKNSGLDKKIIIVDHNPIIKEMVTKRILVTRSGDCSTVGIKEQ